MLFQQLRAKFYERITGQPLGLADEAVPVLGSASPSQGGPLGNGAACPVSEQAQPCPTVCLGLAVDASGGVSPLLLATVFALLGAKALCSCC